MALTALQAERGYILDSIGLFLDRNVKQAYDARVASGPFPAPLTIARGKPDDKSKTLIVPRIMIGTITGTERDSFYGIGTNIKWRHMNLVFYCYPALAAGQPSTQAADLLGSLMQNAWGTYSGKIVDYSNVACTASNIIYCNDQFEVTRYQDPVERKATTNVAEEQNRFDMHVSIRYPVYEPLVS